MIAWIRTLVFRALFYGLSVPIVLSVPISAAFGQRAMIRHAHFWGRTHRFLMHWVLGIVTRVEGAPVAGPVIYASKHQAMYETLELPLVLHGPAVMLKRELSRIPVWGWATQQYGAIIVDREASGAALRSMMRQAEAAKQAGRSTLIFPEGTRVKPGEHPPLRSGFAGLYRMLGIPVVPIAVNSGRLLPKTGAKHPGVVTIRLGEPIPPGLSRGEIEARVHAAINVLETSGAA